MKRAAPKLDHGKQFEQHVAQCFKRLHLTMPCRWERVTDTYVAGNFIDAKEGDFRLTIKSDRRGTPWMFAIECKASILDATFASNFRSLCKGAQIGQMNLVMRAGVLGLFMFHRVQDGKVEFWDGRTICGAYPEKRVKLMAEPFLVIGLDNLETLAKRWVEDPLYIAKHLV